MLERKGYAQHWLLFSYIFLGGGILEILISVVTGVGLSVSLWEYCKSLDSTKVASPASVLRITSQKDIG